MHLVYFFHKVFEYHFEITFDHLHLMLLSYTLDAGNNRHNMDTLSELHLGHRTITYKDLVGTGKKQLNFSTR